MVLPVNRAPGQTITSADINAIAAQCNVNEAGLKAITQKVVLDTTYTLLAADAGTLVEVNNLNATTLTVPNLSVPDGTTVMIRQGGPGQVTVLAGSGNTLFTRGGANKTAGQWAECSLIRRADGQWVFSGDAIA